MRIAIVTVYDSIANYGSFLQAFAMQKTLEAMGHEVFMVRRMPQEEVLNRFQQISRKNVGLDRVPLWNILLKIHRWNRFQKVKKMNKVRMRILSKDWESFHVLPPQDVEQAKIDLILCGSDEIWNVCNRDVDIEFYTCGWNRHIPMKAFAISSGKAAAEQLSEHAKENIRSFSAIYPRDEQTAELCRRLGCQIEGIVPDPTILAGKVLFDSYSNSPQNLGDYMLVYSYVYTPQQKKQLRRYADERGLKLISACIHADFADQTVFTSALEFPSLVRNAKCMYTSTFHGSIFGLMYAQRLCIVPRLGKIQSVVSACDAKQYTADENADYMQIAAVLDQSVERTQMDENLLKFGNAGRKELMKALT